MAKDTRVRFELLFLLGVSLSGCARNSDPVKIAPSMDTSPSVSAVHCVSPIPADKWPRFVMEAPPILDSVSQLVGQYRLVMVKTKGGWNDSSDTLVTGTLIILPAESRVEEYWNETSKRTTTAMVGYVVAPLDDIGVSSLRSYISRTEDGYVKVHYLSSPEAIRASLANVETTPDGTARLSVGNGVDAGFSMTLLGISDAGLVGHWENAVWDIPEAPVGYFCAARVAPDTLAI